MAGTPPFWKLGDTYDAERGTDVSRSGIGSTGLFIAIRGRGARDSREEYSSLTILKTDNEVRRRGLKLKQFQGRPDRGSGKAETAGEMTCRREPARERPADERKNAIRAHGGCLGFRRRRRTWQAAKRHGDPQAGLDPCISEWDNPAG